jgi:hypothetical protein
MTVSGRGVGVGVAENNGRWPERRATGLGLRPAPSLFDVTPGAFTSTGSQYHHSHLSIKLVDKPGKLRKNNRYNYIASAAMKLYIFSLFLALLAITVSSVAPQKAIIITYPDNTPDSVLREAMNAIEEAGGVITHEYSKVKPGSLSV